MTASLHILGIRHHGPGSARMVNIALEALKPEVVLIEGPPDADELVTLASHKDMKPPVALLVYDPENPSDAAYYPFARFSPEWQAIQWGLKHGSPVRFIDLPRALRPEPPTTPTGTDDDADEEDDSEPGDDTAAAESRRTDPLEALASAAGYSDGEAWWGRLIEERRGDIEPIAVFQAIHDAMAAVRAECAPSALDPDEPAREAHMRRAIRAALKDATGNIAVICGAWHAPALTEAALKATTAKADDATLKGLPKRKTATTWIPWTYDRLAFDSGYGAGVSSPGWYDHLWLDHTAFSERWITKVARLMRTEGLDASPASVIETVRLAQTLSSLRGHGTPSLAEMNEATLAVLCHGNPFPLQVIERKLIVGQRLGKVPADAPSVPLHRDLSAQQKSLRLKVSALDFELDLDQRKEIDLARSRFLHRLLLLEIPWGTRAHDQRQRTSTFHELWTLQWKPEFAVSVIEAARYGNTVADAAAGKVRALANAATDLPSLTAMLDDVLLADLPSSVQVLISRIQSVSAVSADIGHLMDALAPLVKILRYGNVRKTDAALVEPLVAGLVGRICAGLMPACGSLNDEAAAEMRARIDAVHTTLVMLDNKQFLSDWSTQLARIGDADIHGLVAGRCWRHLLDSHQADSAAASSRLSMALSPGNDPAKASAWIEGFLAGSGTVLVHDPQLLAIIDEWVTSLPAASFEQICPIGRRTFSTFEAPERRMIGEKIRRGLKPPSVGASQTGDSAAESNDYDPRRGSLVDPVLRLIFGDSAL